MEVGLVGKDGDYGVLIYKRRGGWLDVSTQMYLGFGWCGWVKGMMS
jgi:hypothetical protein